MGVEICVDHVARNLIWPGGSLPQDLWYLSEIRAGVLSISGRMAHHRSARMPRRDEEVHQGFGIMIANPGDQLRYYRKIVQIMLAPRAKAWPLVEDSVRRKDDDGNVRVEGLGEETGLTSVQASRCRTHQVSRRTVVHDWLARDRIARVGRS